MSREATLRRDGLAREALDRFVLRGEGSMASALRTACLYYLADRDSGRPAWRARRFEGASQDTSGATIELDCTTWRELVDEAERQGVSPEALGAHALLYFLADLDSGLLARRLRDALDLPS
jgi:predicted DNA-binding ribbon-helix-helix protein